MLKFEETKFTLVAVALNLGMGDSRELVSKITKADRNCMHSSACM